MGSLESYPGQFAKAPDSSQVVRRLSRCTHRYIPVHASAPGSTSSVSRQASLAFRPCANLRQRLDRLEEVEGAGNIVCEKPRTLRDMYLGEPKNGKRLIIQELFDVRVLGGRVIFTFR